jgi:hypothetical protein
MSLAFIKATQQSVHLTLGSLRVFQAFFYALAFFWLDGFAVPAAGQLKQKTLLALLREDLYLRPIKSANAFTTCGSKCVPAFSLI